MWELCVGFLCRTCGVSGLRGVKVTVCGSRRVWWLRFVGIEVFGCVGNAVWG